MQTHHVLPTVYDDTISVHDGVLRSRVDPCRDDRMPPARTRRALEAGYRLGGT